MWVWDHMGLKLLAGCFVVHGALKREKQERPLVNVRSAVCACSQAFEHPHHTQARLHVSWGLHRVAGQLALAHSCCLCTLLQAPGRPLG